MSNIIQFFLPEDERKKYIFVNKPVMLRRKNDVVPFPCIVLVHKGTMEPIEYPRFERWYLKLDKSEALAATTMRKRAGAVVSFLNYILQNTACDYIHELTLNDIRGFLVAYKEKVNGSQRSNQGWNEGVAAVYEFLAQYYLYNKENFEFKYRYEDLIIGQVVRKAETGRMFLIKDYNCMFVKSPRQLTTKNRQLLYGYMDLFLLNCEMYDPDITIGVASQAYAGLREGEVVNLTHGRITKISAGFGRIGKVEFDLETPAPFATDSRKSGFGSIKKFRKQEVFPDFLDRYLDIYRKHVACMESKGYSVTGNAPLLVDKWGKPMSVHTYTRRIKQVFYKFFLPALKKASSKSGNWAIDAPYIEAYEEDYPGAHAFRHWYTMYLFQRAKLKPDEISKWRGDSNRDSVLTYLHVNADMLDAYKSATHEYQRSWLKEIL